MDTAEVVLDEETHVYTQGGVAAKRTATGLLKKYGLTTDFSDVPKGVLELARQRGKALAIGREYIVKGITLDPATIDLRIAGYLKGLQRFWVDSGAVLIDTEVPRISPLGFGFRADINCWINGFRTVVDDKATYKMPKSVGPQTAFYKIGWNSLYHKEPIERRIGLWLRQDGSYKASVLDDTDDECAALDCLSHDIQPKLETELRLQKWALKYGGKA